MDFTPGCGQRWTTDRTPPFSAGTPELRHTATPGTDTQKPAITNYRGETLCSKTETNTVPDAWSEKTRGWDISLTTSTTLASFSTEVNSSNTTTKTQNVLMRKLSIPDTKMRQNSSFHQSLPTSQSTKFHRERQWVGSWRETSFREYSTKKACSNASPIVQIYRPISDRHERRHCDKTRITRRRRYRREI